jgi:hypothetical protein
MKLSIALVAASLLASTAFAQQQEPQRPAATPDAAVERPAPPPAGPPVDVGGIFDKLDTNHDGKLSRDEAQAHPTVQANFGNADANGDGVITKEEFMAAFKPQQ